jgi:N-acetyl-anhydromuramyl-L-alanine amidase AmpD
MPDTQTWPFVKARWFTSVPAVSPRSVRLCVIHDMEFAERISAAEDVAKYFATTATKASAHVCIDSDSIVQCVWDRDIAYAAPGANHDGIQMELAGYGRQTATEWLDRYSICLLANAADAGAYYAAKFKLPVRKLTDAQVADGVSKGFCGHDQVSRAFKKSDHTDPGSGFPWNYYVRSVQNVLDARAAA